MRVCSESVVQQFADSLTLSSSWFRLCPALRRTCEFWPFVTTYSVWGLWVEDPHSSFFFWRSLNLAVVSWQFHGLTSSLARDVNCSDPLGTCRFGLDALQTFTLVVPVHRRNCLT